MLFTTVLCFVSYHYPGAAHVDERVPNGKRFDLDWPWRRSGRSRRSSPGSRMTRGVLIDLDGTLIETAPDIAAAANAMLADLGCAALEIAQVRSFIGEGIAVLVRRSLGRALERERSRDEALSGAGSISSATTRRRTAGYSSLYPGVA